MTETEEQPRPTAFVTAWLAVAGAALLLIGSFSPVVVLTSGESRSYCDFSWADGNVVLGAAAVAFVLTWVFRWYRGLFVAGGVALFMIGATLLKVPRAGLGYAALSWGWLLLVGGAVLVLVAALVAEKNRPREQAEGQSPDEDSPVDE